MFVPTTSLKKISAMTKRIRAVQGGSCFVAGTLVCLKNGKKIPIEQIKKGDTVLSLSSNHASIGSKVYDLWENAPNKPIIKFSVKGEKIRATYDHKFYTPEGYKELYRIVWGSLDASQRVQLELLCKQHGATFNPYPSRRKKPSDNEACNKFNKRQKEKLSYFKNGDERQNNNGSPCGSDNLHTEPIESSSSRSYKRKQSRQPSGESGVGNTGREYTSSLRNGANGLQTGGVEREVPTQGLANNRNSLGVGHNTSIQQKRTSKKIWGYGIMYKGHSRASHLLPFTPEQIQIQQPEKTFAISVIKENYFVGNSRINVSNSAGKTVALLMLLISQAQSSGHKHAKKNGWHEEPLLISVVSESLPHLKKGAIRNFLDIMQTHKYYKDDLWNRTDFTYTFETGSKIEFFSVDQPDKVKGPRRDILFVNEAPNIDFETFEQLEVRTKHLIFLDWNPNFEFWFYTEMLPNRTDIDHIILTYKDNEGLSPQIVQALEQKKYRKNWWRVYGEGQLGEIEGRIYTNWKTIQEIPHEARLERYGLDFGYTNDPTAIVAVYYYNGGYILDEVCYQTGMSNRDIANLFKNLPRKLIIADCAEPKSIADIKLYGLNVIPTKKGRDSVRNGIGNVQNQQISVTKNSSNLLDEYRRYLWACDHDGKVIKPEEPDASADHLLDAVRYSLSSVISVIQRQELYPVRTIRDVVKNPAR